MRPEALLLDLDGVLRRWDAQFTAAVEQRHGLTPGTLPAAVFEPERLSRVVQGRVRHADWLAELGAVVGSPAAVAEWAGFRGTVDAGVLALVREARAVGVRVGLATNASDRLDEDLAKLGLAGELDVVVNSSVLGVAKPAPEYFAAACRAVAVPPEGCLFVDDTERHVRAARAAGLAAHHWTGPADLPHVRAALGL